MFPSQLHESTCGYSDPKTAAKHSQPTSKLNETGWSQSAGLNREESTPGKAVRGFAPLQLMMCHF